MDQAMSNRRSWVVLLAGAGGLTALALLLWLRRPEDRSLAISERPHAPVQAAKPIEESEIQDGRQEVSAQSSLVEIRLVDDAGQPAGHAEVKLLGTRGGARHATSTVEGLFFTDPGEYVVAIRGGGLTDAIGICDLARPTTLVVARAGAVELSFVADGQPVRGVRARLLLESLSQEETGSDALARALIRKACFEEARLVDAAIFERLRALGFGPAADAGDADRTTGEDGLAVWRGVPPGAYRWQCLSGERMRILPPYEVEPVAEDASGRLHVNAVRRDLSGAFALVPGQVVNLRQEVLRGSSVTGVVLSQGSRPVAEARVTLCIEACSTVTGDTALVPEAHARTDAKGVFQIDNVSPGEKAVFAILDQSPDHHFWMTAEEKQFTLVEGEDRDVGVLSMEGTEVEVRTRFVDSEGRVLNPAEVLQHDGPQASLVVTNGLESGRGFTSQFCLRVGADEPYVLHGLRPKVLLSLASGSRSCGQSWTWRAGYEENVEADTSRRFDPFVDSSIVLDVPVRRVTPCELSFLLPPGASSEFVTNLSGQAVRREDRRSFGMNFEAMDERRFGGVEELPPGRYEVVLTTQYPEDAPNYFFRGELEFPCRSPQEWTLDRGVCLAGLLLNEDGQPLRSAAVRVGFAGTSVEEWWTTVWSDEGGRFALGGVPPGSELVFERGAGTIGIGAVDVLEARVLVLGR
jgi:hypothetical protein